MLGGYLAAGGAGAINHFIERDIDARMTRTSRRPLPSGRVEPRHALWFGIALGVLSFALFAVAVNMTAALARDGRAARLRLRLHDLAEAAHDAEHRDRRRGRRGAAAGRLGRRGRRPRPSAFYLFAIVFYWTPPHFWALALLIKDDYARTGIPMLPVVDGEAETAARSCSTAGCCSRSPRCPSPAGCSAPSTRSRRCCSGGLPVPVRAPAPARRPALGRDPVPLLAAVPGAALLRDGRRPGRLSGYRYTAPMDRRLARKNITHRPDRRRARRDDLRRHVPGRGPVPGLMARPPARGNGAREQIHLPGNTLLPLLHRGRHHARAAGADPLVAVRRRRRRDHGAVGLPLDQGTRQRTTSAAARALVRELGHSSAASPAPNTASRLSGCRANLRPAPAPDDVAHREDALQLGRRSPPGGDGSRPRASPPRPARGSSPVRR